MTDAATQAAAEAPALEGQETPKRRGGRLLVIMIMLMSPFLLVLMQVGFLFMLIGLLPSIVAYIIDIDYLRRPFKTVLACNLAGLAPYMAKLVASGSSKATVQLMMGDPQVWLMIYSSAAGGWVLIWLCRFLAYIYTMLNYQGKVLLLENAQKRLEDEWGEKLNQPAA